MPLPKSNAHARELAEMAHAYVFRPTPKQRDWLNFFKTRAAGLTMTQTARAYGLDSKLFWRWRLQPGFGQWVFEQVMNDRGVDFAEVHTLAMERYRRGGALGASYFKQLYPNLGKAAGAFKDVLEIVGADGKPLSLMSDEQLREMLERLSKAHAK